MRRLIEADATARRTALTALDRSLLVEAGAGSGKTSVLAGRVAALLAAGRTPGSIAAISFTELAAGELRERIELFVDDLIEGRARPDLQAAFPNGADVAQRIALRAARAELDQLACSTIHGFCQRPLRPYPAEAGMDPGASVMDREEADALFADVFGDWLRERLSGERVADDHLVTLYLSDPAKMEATLRKLAEEMLKRPDARIAPPMPNGLAGLHDAVTSFRRWLNGVRVREPETVDIAAALGALCATPCPDEMAASLLYRLHLPVPEACATNAGAFTAYRRKGKWVAALRGSGSAAEAARLNEMAAAHYLACWVAHDAVRSRAAGELLYRLAGELHVVLGRFAAAKRAAALIDFDDLLRKARDLLVARPEVRDALAGRFTTVLVDEFQDTDTLQCEILWRLCGEASVNDADWTHRVLRPGALFLVGDPKQAIYRFRGADVSCYLAARDRLLASDPDARVVIGQNFRSVSPILDWVNERFEAPLCATGQPGFQALFSTTAVVPGRLPVAALMVAVPEGGNADAIRDAEAEEVAAFCARIIGALPVRGRDGERPCRAGDIALLAPTGTDLWRYERALEDQDIAVSTQAGKGFYRRQEVQDLIALTRVLADGRDTLALGALLRGPLIGLTEEQLLDAVAALPETEHGDLPRLTLWTPIEHVSHSLLRETLEILQSLARNARSTTPYVLLCQAVEELQLRPLLRRRHDRTAERALANLDLYLEAARGYDLRGLRAFASAMRAQWEDAQRALEGRPDGEQQSVSLVTMHSSKGLEWPVVVPINLGTRVKNGVDAALDADGVLHMPMLGQHAPGTASALEAESAELERERHRLLYVATTRARDLLLLPALSCGAPTSSWAACIVLGAETLDAFAANELGEARHEREDEVENAQDRPRFETEAALIAERTRRIKRLTPHLAEAEDVILASEETPLWIAEADDVPPLPRGSLARGLVLHKLLEEVLTGETLEKEQALASRAGVLAAELADVPGASGLDASEAARAVLRGLALPEIAALRDRLVPEYWVAASVAQGEDERVTLGVADAVARGPDGHTEVIVDWKSDVVPSAHTIANYRAQLGAYLDATETMKGLLVFLTAGRVERVDAMAKPGFQPTGNIAMRDS
jgi:exodeoxyribonuclease-5